MSNSPLLYNNTEPNRFTFYNEYIYPREVITWSAAKFPFQYAAVEIQSVGQEYWPPGPQVVDAMSVGDVELNFIRKVFRELDKSLSVSFVETSPQDADITLMALLPDKPDNNGGGLTRNLHFLQIRAEGPS